MANNPYVNKVVFGNNTVMDISGDTATPSDVLKGETFHDKSGALQVGTLSLDEFATIDLLKDTVGWTGKNLLQNTATSQTISGVTFTINSDGSVTANGTATTDASFVLFYASDTYNFLNKRVILSGCPSGGSNTTYFINGYRMASKSGGSGSSVEDTGNGVEFDALNDGSGIVGYIAVVVKPNYTANNLTFYPMLRDASIIDSTYEPYHKSVEEVVGDIRVEQRVLGAKNWFDFSAKQPVTSGVSISGSADNFEIIGSNVYRGYIFTALVEPYTEYRIKTDITVTSGIAVINVKNGTDTLNIYTTSKITQSEDNVTFTFNSGNNTKVLIRLFSTYDVNESGDVTYKNFMLYLASDPDDTYVPYAMTNKELTDSLDGWTATSQVANEQVTFTGLDDTQGWGYDPRIWIDDNSTNLNPYCRINSMTGAGTANMSITYDTDADNGAYVRLRIIK